MQFTKRQTVLLDRIERLLSQAEDFPCQIVEEWGEPFQELVELENNFYL